MVEYDYPECTTSVITGLSHFKKYYPNYRAAEIDTTIRRAIKYLHSIQRAEGGWYGSWGICFTYATMFALESLSLVGESYRTSDYARRACEFLISNQKEDGGWGETYKVCKLRGLFALCSAATDVGLLSSLVKPVYTASILNPKSCILHGRS